MDIEVLFIDDEEDLRRAASQMLDLAGFAVRAINSAQKALSIISQSYPGIVVSDIRMPKMDGMELLKKIMEIDSDMPVIMVTGHGDINLAVDAMVEGAYDFIEKPFSEERFLDAIVRALEKRELTLENRQLRNSVAKNSDNLESQIVGRSMPMVEIREQIRAIAPTPADVLIVGETGTGKELAARAIHEFPPNNKNPFVVINCAALPRNMIEAELFGYEAGAFLGATRARFGKFEHARNGTIFLDEIMSMPMDVQAKLLRVIDERAVMRLGSNELIKLNARFITASSEDLEQAAKEGKFRTDLLYRLNVATIKMPPLAERREDIPELFIHLLNQAALKLRVSPQKPSDNFLAELSAKEWAGNVRELRNAADRFALGLDKDKENFSLIKNGLLAQRIAAFERQAIAGELRANGGALKPSYEALGLSRKTLYEKMQKHGLSREDFKAEK
jgi:two-component system C4-dicarboxylate transport response regulator DctD